MGETYSDDAIEAVSGKGAGDENFPVGSFLIAPPLRPHVTAYYNFARAADDIGDHQELSSDEKLYRLEAYRQVLRGEATGLSNPSALRAALLETGVPFERGTDLLDAFAQDAVKSRYATLDELFGYCRMSANPVGQFLLDLHGEDRAMFSASDALCTSLQILNHLQDCGDDLREIDRSYLPQAWLDEEGAKFDDVLGEASTPGLRRVIDLPDPLFNFARVFHDDFLYHFPGRRGFPWISIFLGLCVLLCFFLYHVIARNKDCVERRRMGKSGERRLNLSVEINFSIICRSVYNRFQL